jgi:hypothetical protein
MFEIEIDLESARSHGCREGRFGMSIHLNSGFDSTWLRTSIQNFFRLFAMLLFASFISVPGPANAQVERYGYFSVTPDLRLCPAPVCGGFHLQAVNQPTTTCADGAQLASCYVASADFGALEADGVLASGEIIVRGLLVDDEYPGFGNLGRLVVESAWAAATPQSAQGTIYRVRDLGIVCVTTPCFSIEARILNESTVLTLSSLDLDAVGATPSQIAAALAAAQRGDLLVAGTTAPDPGPAGAGLALLASQFWLPEPAKPRCLSDAECSTTTHCNADEICLPPPECEPGDACPAVCSGYCAAATCTDLIGYDFGPCDAVLGWAIVGGICVEVSGCDPGPFVLGSSRGECQAACLAAPAVPALAVPIALAVWIGLIGVALSKGERT